MRNFLIFVSRYNAFFLFIAFFVAGLAITLSNNDYNRNIALNSTNYWAGRAYERLNIINNYLRLKQTNDSLAVENAHLRNIITAYITTDTTREARYRDTTGHLQYTYIPARVVKNSIVLRNNYITLARGSADGVTKGMGVISPDKGVVGIITAASEHYSLVRSLLNKGTHISIALKKNMTLGSLTWGDSNYDATSAFISDIPNQVKINRGDTVITSGGGVFPQGIEVGRVIQTDVTTGDNFLGARIKLFNDFSSMQYVYIVKNKLAAEQQQLEGAAVNEH